MLERFKSLLIPTVEDGSQKHSVADPDVKVLVRQMEQLMAEAFSVHRRLLNCIEGKPTLSRSLSNLFVEPLTASGAISPYASIQLGVQFGFEPTGSVSLTSKPKTNFGDSPDSCTNTLFVDFKGPSKWLTIETAFSWEEIDQTKSYQIGIYGVASRALTIRAALRLPRREGDASDQMFSASLLPQGERAVNMTGLLELENQADYDRTRQPKLLLSFDTVGDVSLRLDYITAYFV